MKKKNNMWDRRRTGTHGRGIEEERRRNEREEEYLDICTRLEYLGDPYENMDMTEKKVHGITYYYQLIKVFTFNLVAECVCPLNFPLKEENLEINILNEMT